MVGSKTRSMESGCITDRGGRSLTWNWAACGYPSLNSAVLCRPESDVGLWKRCDPVFHRWRSVKPSPGRAGVWGKGGRSEPWGQDFKRVERHGFALMWQMSATRLQGYALWLKGLCRHLVPASQSGR